MSIEIVSTKRNFMKRFFILDDKYNKNFSKDKLIELNFTNRSPINCFQNIMGKPSCHKSKRTNEIQK